MTTRTETVETVYGDVEVSLVDCDSCGNPVRKRDAVEFSIGDRDGWACEHCEEEGPLSFPERMDTSTDWEEKPVVVGLVAVISPLAFVGALADDVFESVAFAGMFAGGVFYATFMLLWIVPGAMQWFFSLLPF